MGFTQFPVTPGRRITVNTWRELRLGMAERSTHVLPAGVSRNPKNARFLLGEGPEPLLPDNMEMDVQPGQRFTGGGYTHPLYASPINRVRAVIENMCDVLRTGTAAYPESFPYILTIMKYGDPATASSFINPSDPNDPLPMMEYMFGTGHPDWLAVPSRLGAPVFERFVQSGRRVYSETLNELQQAVTKLLWPFFCPDEDVYPDYLWRFGSTYGGLGSGHITLYRDPTPGSDREFPPQGTITIYPMNTRGDGPNLGRGVEVIERLGGDKPNINEQKRRGCTEFHCRLPSEVSVETIKVQFVSGKGVVDGTRPRVCLSNDSFGSLGNIPITSDVPGFSIEGMGHGTLTRHATGYVFTVIGSAINAGDTLTLNDGVHFATIFEFTKGGSPTFPNVAVPITDVMSESEIAVALITAINAAGTLDITAKTGISSADLDAAAFILDIRMPYKADQPYTLNPAYNIDLDDPSIIWDGAVNAPILKSIPSDDLPDKSVAGLKTVMTIPLDRVNLHPPDPRSRKHLIYYEQNREAGDVKALVPTDPPNDDALGLATGAYVFMSDASVILPVVAKITSFEYV